MLSERPPGSGIPPEPRAGQHGLRWERLQGSSGLAGVLPQARVPGGESSLLSFGSRSLHAHKALPCQLREREGGIQTVPLGWVEEPGRRLCSAGLSHPCRSPLPAPRSPLWVLGPPVGQEDSGPTSGLNPVPTLGSPFLSSRHLIPVPSPWASVWAERAEPQV